LSWSSPHSIQQPVRLQREKHDQVLGKRDLLEYLRASLNRPAS
jgi:hypothetical protein